MGRGANKNVQELGRILYVNKSYPGYGKVPLDTIDLCLGLRCSSAKSLWKADSLLWQHLQSKAKS